MILGIDASNLRGGGGITHLVELLKAADPSAHGFSKVIVWSGQATLQFIKSKPWLEKSHQAMLDKNLLYRIYWQRFNLSRLARVAGCDVLFVPGGSFAGNYRPVVTMSQNLLPFEWREMSRYGFSWMLFKMMMLRLTQSRTFQKADGIIFLTKYARGVVMRVIKTTAGTTVIIPHGINSNFINLPRKQKPINCYSSNQPFRIIYVSVIDVYKHQWHVAEAVSRLQKSGLPVLLDLVGPASDLSWKRLQKKLDQIDPQKRFLQYAGALPREELPARHAQADLCLFASSCENMPNILLEGMASGLPIACSCKGPMPEVVGDSGIYFDPENPDDIANALRKLIENPALRTKLTKDSYERAQSYSWAHCARETFTFIAKMAHNNRAGKK